MSTTDTSKSDKFNKAVTRATGAGNEIDAPTVPLTADVAAMVKATAPGSIAERLSTGKYEAAPQLFKLEPGQEISGVLEGHGPDAEFEHLDKVTGVVTTSTVKTWIIADPSGAVRVSVLSSAQLDKKMNGFIGGPITIARGQDVNISGGRRMTEYIVFGPKIEGKRRQWFDVDDTERAIMEARTQHALPAGHESNHAS